MLHKKNRSWTGKLISNKRTERPIANRTYTRAPAHTHALSRVHRIDAFVFAFGFTFAQNQGPGFMLFGTVITRAYFIGLLIKLNGYSTMAATYLQSMAKNEEPTSNLNETQANNVTNVTN